MAALIKVVCLFTIRAIVLMATAAADPGIDISPSEISPGITSVLDINCTFSLKNHPDLVALVSLSLSRANTSGQNFAELAVITQFTPDSVNPVTQEKISATGHLSQTEQSFIQITWEYPTAVQAGVYQCAAHSLDMLGHMVDLTNTSIVTVDQANLNEIMEKLKQMEMHEKYMENTISSLENASLSMEYTVSVLENRIKSLETWRHSTIANKLALIGTYQDKEYYLSKAEFQDITESEATCKLFGGTVIEIDDEKEYKAIVAFLQNVDSAIKRVIIGGTDEATEGEWLLPSTNQPLPYTAWHSGQPGCGTECNCLGLLDYSDNPWTMFNTHCHHDSLSGSLRFSCEIPSVANTSQK